MTDKKDHEIIEPAKAAEQPTKEFTDAFEAEISRLTDDKEIVQPTDKTGNETVESAKAAARSAKEFTDAFEAEMSKLANDKGTGQLTAKEIFTQLTVLQKQLTESPYNSINYLTKIDTVVENKESSNSKIMVQFADVCNAFKAREETLRKLLGFYEKMYDDIKKGQDKPMKNENPGS